MHNPPHMKTLRAQRNRGGQRGFTLLETLVAIVIFSIGMLGVVGLQARAIQYAVDGEDRNRAALLADDVVATLWANGVTSTAWGSGTSTGSATVVPTAAIDAWQDRVAATLPQGVGALTGPDANGVFTVSITWRAPQRAAADSSSSYVTKVAMP